MKVDIEHFLDESEPGEEAEYYYEGDDYTFSDGEQSFRARVYIDTAHEASFFMNDLVVGTSRLAREAAYYLQARGVCAFECLDGNVSVGYRPIVFTPPLEREPPKKC